MKVFLKIVSGKPGKCIFNEGTYPTSEIIQLNKNWVFSYKKKISTAFNSFTALLVVSEEIL